MTEKNFQNYVTYAINKWKKKLYTVCEQDKCIANNINLIITVLRLIDT